MLTTSGALHQANWSISGWAKNLTNSIYNAEYSPGGFVFKALPRRYGLELTMTF